VRDVTALPRRRDPAHALVERALPVDTDDGVRLFSRAFGEPGAPAIVLLDGLGCDGYVWRHVIPWFAPRHHVVHWHYRGHGKSAPPLDMARVSIDQVMGDLARVLDAHGVSRAVFMGHSMGVQIALESRRRMPARVSGLALLFGSYAHPIESWHGAPERHDGPRLSNLVMRATFDTLSSQMAKRGHLIRGAWRRVMETAFAYEVATRTEVDGEKLSWSDFGPYLQHVADMDPRVFFSLARALAGHSAEDVLHAIDVPTLVVGGGRDTFTPLWRSREMGARIPGCDLLLLDDATHSGPLEHPTRINERIARLLRSVDARAR